MAGYMHITRLSKSTGTHDIVPSDYQVNYVDSGINYAASWGEERLVEFLRTKVALDEFEAAQVMSRLTEKGNVTIGDIELRAVEATSSGMEMISD